MANEVAKTVKATDKARLPAAWRRNSPRMSTRARSFAASR